MLVYGDAACAADPRQVLAALRRRLETLDWPGPPVERHARLSSLFIAAAELAQGLADAAMAAQDGDGASPQEDAALALVMDLARALLASWQALGGEAEPAKRDDDALRAALTALEGLSLPAEVQLKTAEGYAFYALYPEAYAEAAAQLEATDQTTVIGVRSIGSGLAAIVAAALGTGAPITVRPVGHPFHRHLRLQPELRATLQSRLEGRFVVVDEGPGLSGSSFGAVADALEALGAPSSAIAFLPGHGGGLGAQASEAHSVRWAAAERPCVDLDALLLRADPAARTLPSWFADLTGSDAVSLKDISGGAWRALRYTDEADWPAANTYQERRKFLLTSARGTWLLKFVGLGEAGERAFAHAKALADAGFAPEASALRYGFLAQPWLASSRPLRLSREDRPRFVRRLGEYLGFRAAQLPAPEHAGASLETLLHMARVNAAEALGPRAAEVRAFDVARWAAAAPLHRVWTDNRLHAQEWLQLEDGGWLKTDGADHAAAHDLIGAQDIAWDVVGARVEFDLSPAETTILLEALRARAEVDFALVELLEPAYLAFQLGAFTMATDAHTGWPQEHQRLSHQTAVYRRRLAQVLDVPSEADAPSP